MIIVQYFKPIRLHERTPVRNLRTIVDLLIHSGGQLCPKRYYSRWKKSCGGPNLVLGSKLVNIVRMSPLLSSTTFWCKKVQHPSSWWQHDLSFSCAAKGSVNPSVGVLLSYHFWYAYRYRSCTIPFDWPICGNGRLLRPWELWGVSWRIPIWPIGPSISLPFCCQSPSWNTCERTFSVSKRNKSWRGQVWKNPWDCRRPRQRPTTIDQCNGILYPAERFSPLLLHLLYYIIIASLELSPLFKNSPSLYD